MPKGKPTEHDVELRRVPRSADQTHAYVHDQGFICRHCNHRHFGALLGFICVGCECTAKAPSIPDFERMRMIVFLVEVEYLPSGNGIELTWQAKAKGAVH